MLEQAAHLLQKEKSLLHQGSIWLPQSPSADERVRSCQRETQLLRDEMRLLAKEKDLLRDWLLKQYLKAGGGADGSGKCDMSQSGDDSGFEMTSFPEDDFISTRDAMIRDDGVPGDTIMSTVASTERKANENGSVER